MLCCVDIWSEDSLEEVEVPTQKDMRRRASQTWEGVLNFQVYDMNAFLFLFRGQEGLCEHLLQR